jgi:hypothetical protein
MEAMVGRSLKPATEALYAVLTDELEAKLIVASRKILTRKPPDAPRNAGSSSKKTLRVSLGPVAGLNVLGLRESCA